MTTTVHVVFDGWIRTEGGTRLVSWAGGELDPGDIPRQGSIVWHQRYRCMVIGWRTPELWVETPVLWVDVIHLSTHDLVGGICDDHQELNR